MSENAKSVGASGPLPERGPTGEVAYFKKRVAEWREMPILGHGLWARYQDAQMLLDDAEKLLTAVAAERGDVAEQLAEALRKIANMNVGASAVGGQMRDRARAALAVFSASRR